MLKRLIQIALISTLVSTVYATSQVSANQNNKDHYLSGRLSYLLTKNRYLIVRNKTTGSIYNSRTVDFHFNPTDGSITHGNEYLEGYAVPRSKNTDQYIDVNIPHDVMPAQPTSSLAWENVNLSSTDGIPPNTFNPNDPMSYDLCSTGIFYDSAGVRHELQLFFVKTSSVNAWQIYVVSDGATTIAQGAATFHPDGTLSSITGLDHVVAHIDGADQALKLDLSITQIGALNIAGYALNDGYAQGIYLSYQITDSGSIYVSYSNGQTKSVSQIALVNN